MTLKEVCEKFGYDEKSFSKNFSRNQEAILKKYGVHLKKQGRGASANYYIEEEQEQQHFFLKDLAAQEGEYRSLVPTELVLANDELYCLLVVLFSPMGVFRGNYGMFLKYAELDKNKIEEIKIIIDRLVEKEYIRRAFDNSTDEGYFILASRRDIERECELNIPIKELRKVINVAKEHNTHSWIPVFKIWAAVSSLDGEVSTSNQLAALTGLTKNQVDYYSRMLRESNIFVSKKIYINKGKENIKCIGTEKTISADWVWKESEEK